MSLDSTFAADSGNLVNVKETGDLDASQSQISPLQKEALHAYEVGPVASADHASGFTNVAANFAAGVADEVIDNPVGLAENAGIGFGLGYLTKIGLEVARKPTLVGLVAAGAYGVYELISSVPGWMRSYDLASNPQGKDLAAVQNAEKHIQSLGGSALELAVSGYTGSLAFKPGVASATEAMLGKTREAIFGGAVKAVAAENAAFNAGLAPASAIRLPQASDVARASNGGLSADTAVTRKPVEAAPEKTAQAEGFAKIKTKEPKGYAGVFLKEKSADSLRNPLISDGKSFPVLWEVRDEFHATTKFLATIKDTPSEVRQVRVMGLANDGKGVEAIAVKIDGEMNNPSGSPYHITRSLAPGRTAKESADVISKAIKADELRKAGQSVPEELQGYEMHWLKEEEQFDLDFTPGFKAFPVTPKKRPETPETPDKDAIAEPAVAAQPNTDRVAPAAESVSAAEFNSPAAIRARAAEIGKTGIRYDDIPGDRTRVYDSEDRLIMNDFGKLRELFRYDKSGKMVEMISLRDRQPPYSAEITDEGVWMTTEDGSKVLWKGTMAETGEWERSVGERMPTPWAAI